MVRCMSEGTQSKEKEGRHVGGRDGGMKVLRGKGSGERDGKRGKGRRKRRNEERKETCEKRRGERVARSYNATTGLGCAGFHAKVPQDLSKVTRREVVKMGDGRNSLHDHVFFFFFMIPRALHCSSAHSGLLTDTPQMSCCSRASNEFSCFFIFVHP